MSQDKFLRRKRDLGQIIDGTLSIYSQNFVVFILIASAIVPLSIAAAALDSAIADGTTSGIIGLLLALAQFIVSLVVVGALIGAVAELDAGRLPNFGSAYDLALGKLGRLAGAGLVILAVILPFFVMLVAGVVVAFSTGWDEEASGAESAIASLLFLGGLVLIIPTIYFIIRWLFILYAIVLDDTTVRAALTYSSDATGGNWWRTLGIFLLVVIIGSIGQAIVTVPFLLAPPIISGAAQALASVLLLPFYVIVLALLYSDLRFRKESLTSGSS